MPAYANAPIQEAVCEFQFVPLQGNPEWDLTLPGKLQLQQELAEYSGPSRQQHVQTIQATKGQADIAVSNILFRIHLPTKDGRALLSVGHNTFGVIVQHPYEGWTRFRSRIVQALEVYVRLSGQTAVQRIGLRYINRLVTPTAGAYTASQYLTGLDTEITASTQMKRQVAGKLTAINTRQEFETADRVKIFITHATINPTVPKTSEYLLDIDVVHDTQVIEGIAQITPVMDKLHDIEGGIFEALITEEARKLFNAAPAKS
jgi:uncharacterized protein (TIGR04255 family)